MTLPDDWYYAESGKRIGPLTLRELRDTILDLPDAENVFVWCEGFEGWERAGDVPALMVGMPPPLPVHPRLLNTGMKGLIFPTWNSCWKGALIGFLAGGVIVPWNGNMGVPANFLATLIAGPFIVMIIGGAIGAFLKPKQDGSRSKSFILALIILPLLVVAKIALEFHDGNLIFHR